MTVEGTGANTPSYVPAPQKTNAGSKAVQTTLETFGLKTEEATNLPGAQTTSSFQKTTAGKEHEMEPVALPSRFPPTASTVQVASSQSGPARYSQAVQQQALDSYYV